MKTQSFRGEDEVQCAAVNLPRAKRRGVPRERTMGTGCISKISVSVSEGKKYKVNSGLTFWNTAVLHQTPCHVRSPSDNDRQCVGIAIIIRDRALSGTKHAEILFVFNL